MLMLPADEDKAKQPTLCKTIQGTKLKGLPSESITKLLGVEF